MYLDQSLEKKTEQQFLNILKRINNRNFSRNGSVLVLYLLAGQICSNKEAKEKNTFRSMGRLSVADIIGAGEAIR